MSNGEQIYLGNRQWAQRVWQTGNIVPLNEPTSSTTVAPGANLDITFDMRDFTKYVVFVLVSETHPYEVKARYLTSTGVLIATGFDDVIIASANQSSKKTAKLDVLSPKITIRYTNQDSVSRNIWLFVFGVKG
jgi:hypothetical protein